MTLTALAQLFKDTLGRETPQLRALTESQAAERPKAEGWSRKEELGHLLDSAVNNHVRLVRASLDGRYQGPGYEQDGWVRAHGYHEIPWANLVDMWEKHNALLLEVTQRIAPDRLGAPCEIGANAAVTLGFVIEDYVLHMQHHLDHLLGRPKVTAYPSATQPAVQPD